VASADVLERRERARRLLWKGDAAGARAEYDRAIAAHPDEPLLLAGRAALRDPAGAKEDVDRALALDPRCADALLARARLAESPRAALEDAERALEAEPSHLPARYWRAMWRAGFGEQAAAEADLKAVAGAGGDDLLTLQYRAFAAMALQDAKGARVLLDRAIAGGVTAPGIHQLRAEARGRLRDARGAIEDWTKVLEADPGAVLARIERAYQSRLAGFPSDAMRDLEEALALAPAHPAPRVHRAMARSGLNPEGAREDLELAAQASVEDVEGFFYRGLAKELMGRGPSATADFERARQQAPPFHRLRPDLDARLDPAKRKEAEPLLQPGGLGTSPISVVIMALNIGIWLVQGEPYLMPEKEDLVARGALSRPEVWGGDVWRLFTAMFLHIGAIHLFWNVYAGFGWCGAVERHLGSGRFLAAYLTTGLVASASSLLGLGPMKVAAGASGALFGVLGVALVILYFKLGSLREFLHHPGVRVMLLNIGLWFVIGALVLRMMDNYAHGGGLVAGLILGWLFARSPAWSRPKRIVAWILTFILLGAFVVSACIPW
jgi:membrane associated rhomboid family serine protease